MTLGFASGSRIFTYGRIAVARALAHTRALLGQPQVGQVLIVAADSLINWPALNHYGQKGRLLTSHNTNGFMPGEGAGALLVRRPAQSSGAAELVCTGIGFGEEKAHIDSDEPLRARGLETAIKAALQDAGTQMHDMDFRITDVSGEQYYFKEAALALSRTLRQRKEEFDHWHPAQYTGEAGALAGVSVIALADAACRKGYTKGPGILAHMGIDAGPRAALALRFTANDQQSLTRSGNH
jgi:3-oxoacyl-[acyl-carrier-protein] synthase-1